MLDETGNLDIDQDASEIHKDEHLCGSPAQDLQDDSICGQLNPDICSQLHRINRRSGRSTAHRCPVCDAEFPWNYMLKHHLIRVHQAEESDLIDKIIPVDAEVIESPLAKKFKGLPKFVCPMCTERFESRDSLVNHIENDHAGIRPFVCSICEATHLIELDLINHIRVKHKKLPPEDVFEDPAYFIGAWPVKNMRIRGIGNRERYFIKPEPDS